MSQRQFLPFQQIRSTAPGFQTTSDSTSQAFALETTSIREFQGPFNRSVRVSGGAVGNDGATSADFDIAFGEDSAIKANSTDGMRILGGTVELFHVHPSITHVAVISSTTVNVNFALGYGS